MKRSKIITTTILLVSFISLFNDIASEMLYPVMPVYLKSIGFSVLLIGILEGLAEAVAGLSKGYFGRLSDVTGKRIPFVRIGYAMSVISKPLMVAFVYPLWIFFTRTLDRLGKGVRTSARDAILSDETTPDHKGKVFGFHRGFDTLGAAIGPVIALIFLYFYPRQYKWLFLLAVMPGVIAISLSFLVKDKRENRKKNTGRPGFLSFLAYWKRSSSPYKKLVMGLLVFTLFNSSDVFLLLALKNQGYSDTHMIGFYIFYNLVYALLSYPVGILADKIGLKHTLVAGLLIFAVVYAGMGWSGGFWFFGLLFFFYAIYAASTEGISKALITNLAGQSETATAIGFYTSMSSLFTMLASSLAGWIWFAFGPKTMFLVSAAGVFAVVIYFVLFSFPGNKQPENR